MNSVERKKYRLVVGFLLWCLLVVSGVFIVVATNPVEAQTVETSVPEVEFVYLNCQGDPIAIESSGTELLASCVRTNPTPTATPPIPTVTPTVTPTISPSPTGTPTPNPTGCDVASHVVTDTHGIYNDVDNCFYDHSHGRGDAQLSDLFVSIVGQNLSYPWCTSPLPDGTCKENKMFPDGKHEAYNTDSGYLGGDTFTCLGGDDTCKMKYEAEWHGMSNNMGMRTRFHSFYAIVYPDVSPNGYIAWGGFMDCGDDVTIDNVHIISTDGSRPDPQGTAIRHSQWWNNSQTWYCQLPDLFIENNFGQHYGDDSGLVTVENLFAPMSNHCDAYDDDCMLRGQRKQVELILFDLSRQNVRDIVDPDGNGWVEHFERWTDRYGKLQPEGLCEENGLDCVPLIIHDVPTLRFHVQGNVFEKLIVDSIDQITHLDWWNREDTSSTFTVQPIPLALPGKG